MTRKESAMPDKVNNLQDMFLNSLRRSKTPVTMFLVKGVKLQGIITWFDNFSVLLRRDGQAQLIYKHAISTIMPAQPIDLGGLQAAFAEQLEKKKPTLLQEVFLTAVKKSGEHVTMFLVHGATPPRASRKPRASPGRSASRSRTGSISKSAVRARRRCSGRARSSRSPMRYARPKPSWSSSMPRLPPSSRRIWRRARRRR